jgi:hypothetical protein
LANDTVSRRKALALVGAGAAAALLPFAQSAKATGGKKCRKTHCNPKAQGNNCGQKFCRCKRVTSSGPPGFQGKCVPKKKNGGGGGDDDDD